MNHNTGINENGWEPCAPGTLSKKSGRAELADPDRRSMILKMGLGAILAAAGLRAYFAATVLKPDPLADFIPCSEVQANLVGYVAHTLHNQPLTKKIGLHLRVCSVCNQIYVEKKQKRKA